MLRRVCTVCVAAVTLVPVAAALGVVPASAAPASGTTFVWVGSTPHQGDGHSWTDARNWEPQGVPGNGDSVSIDASNRDTCTSEVDQVPSSVRLKSFSLVALAGCQGAVHGGSITVAGSLTWEGGTVDSALTIAPGATGAVQGRDGVTTIMLDQDLDVQGTLEVQAFPAVVNVAPGVTISVSSGGSLQIDPGSQIAATECCENPSVLQLGPDGTISVPSDSQRFGDAFISGLLVHDESGTTTIAPDSGLRIVDGPRGSLDSGLIQGGGTLLLGDPTDSENATSFLDGSRLVLVPGGSIDGTSSFEGDGFFTWRGGHLSGVDLGFTLAGFTVAGRSPKVIDEDNGFFSNVEIINNVTFAAGSPAHHNVLDAQGGSFDTFFSTITMHDSVEIADGPISSSQGNYVIDAGPGGNVYLDRKTFVSVSGQLDLVSGTLNSMGVYDQALPDSATVVEKGALLRAPIPEHPVLIEQGILTGQGVVDGNVVSSGGTFEPYNAGSPMPLQIRGSYTQEPDAQLLLDLSAQSRPVRIGGFATIQGTVTYDNQAGYVPRMGEKRRVLMANRSLSWTPGCEETTGSGSDVGHWATSQFFTRVPAVFTSGAGSTC